MDEEREGGGPREPMQRARIGVTGLAAVMILVVLLVAGASFVRNRTVGGANVVATNSSAEEPLAQLGVTPGKTDNATGNGH